MKESYWIFNLNNSNFIKGFKSEHFLMKIKIYSNKSWINKFYLNNSCQPWYLSVSKELSTVLQLKESATETPSGAEDSGVGGENFEMEK